MKPTDKYAAGNKINKVILSCATREHFVAALRMLYNFNRKYQGIAMYRRLLELLIESAKGYGFSYSDLREGVIG